jgi:RNA-directed DNA polymerase
VSSLAKLQAAKSLDDVAALLGFKPASLAYILSRIPNAQKYTEFEIPKRSGDMRKIMAPDVKLKLLQRRVANLLYHCLTATRRVHHGHLFLRFR